MRQLTAFMKKECMDLIRSGRLMILVIVFVLFGIMNPAMAKLTPWIMEMASGSLEGSGLMIGEVTVDAMTSWAQFYKNVPLAMVIFLLMFAGIFTAEYQKGTLIPMVTKGLARWKVVVSKTAVMFLAWSALYWMCYGITFGYNAYFWDNSAAAHVGFAAFCLYLLGVWLIFLTVLVSAAVSSNSAVLLLTGVVFGSSYFLGMLSEIRNFLPTYLMNSAGLLSGEGIPGDYRTAIIVVLAACVVQAVLAVSLFNRRNVVNS